MNRGGLCEQCDRSRHRQNAREYGCSQRHDLWTFTIHFSFGGWPSLSAPLLVSVDSIPAEGAPSFRVMCERVGRTDLKFSRFIRRWFPPLQRTQGWGTLIRDDVGKIEGWASRHQLHRYFNVAAQGQPTSTVRLGALFRADRIICRNPSLEGRSLTAARTRSSS
jgi:hypothetical protein